MGRPVLVAMLVALLAPAPAVAQTLEPLGEWGTGDQIGPKVEAIAATEDGSIAVADHKRDRVVVFGYDRKPAGGFAADDPRGIAAVPGGGYVVAEEDGARRFDADGKPLAEYRARDPQGVALSGDTVLIADDWSGRILRYRLDGTPLQPWDARLRDPRGLATAADGSVFAADHGAWAIKTFSATGERTGGWYVPDPHGVAVSGDGVVYVASRLTHRLAWFTADGERLGSLGTHPSGPRAVTVDCRGTVTVAGDSSPRLAAYGDPAAPPPPCVSQPPPPPPPPPPVEPFAPVAPPAPPSIELPEIGRTAAATPVSGTVFVGAGGERRRLTERTILPVETELDATEGAVELVFETVEQDFQRGVFRDGSFTIHQGRARTLVELMLTGEVASEATTAQRRRRKRRRLWGNAQGEFRTTGRHGAATVRGTRWLTEDRRTGTFIRVVEGSVLAEAFERDQRRVLHAPASFLARPACASRRNFRIRLRVPVGVSVRSARVVVGGKRVRIRRGARLTAPINLRGQPRGDVTVRIRVVTAAGTVLRETRTYRTCAGARG